MQRYKLDHRPKSRLLLLFILLIALEFSILAIAFPPQQTIIVYALVFLIPISWVFLFRYFPRYLRKKMIFGESIVLLLAISFLFIPVIYPAAIASLRFHIFEPYYEKESYRISRYISTLPSQHFDSLKGVRTSSLLSINGTLFYEKDGENILTYFVADQNFFHLYAYLHISSSTYSQCNSSSDYDFVYQLNDTWSYVKVY